MAELGCTSGRSHPEERRVNNALLFESKCFWEQSNVNHTDMGQPRGARGSLNAFWKGHATTLHFYIVTEKPPPLKPLSYSYTSSLEKVPNNEHSGWFPRCAAVVYSLLLILQVPGCFIFLHHGRKVFQTLRKALEKYRDWIFRRSFAGCE